MGDERQTSIKNWQRKKIMESVTFQTKAFEEVNELIVKERKGRKLILSDGRILVDFISCSYLGLDLDERVIKAACDNIRKCGVTFPVARTRAKMESFIVLEDFLNKIFCNSFTTIFSTLHLAHLGFLPMLGSGKLPGFPLKKNGIDFILDTNVHASIQINRGLMNQFGKILITNFHETNELEDLLKESIKNEKTPILIADSIGSMGGTIPVKELYNLTEKYEGYLYLDDAHGTSIFGKNGCGYILECLDNDFPKRLILASSLAKAFGGIAGIIALPNKEDADMLKRYSQTYIFGGPPGLSIIDSAIASAKIHMSDEIKELQKKLWSNVNYFDETFGAKVFNYKLKSPIRGLSIGDEFMAIKFAKALQKRGFALTTALYPTVAKGKSLLRIALSSEHTRNDIEKLYAAVGDVIDEGV